VLVGHPQPRSRTGALAEHVADAIEEAIGPCRRDLTALSAISARVNDFADESVSEVAAAVGRTDILVVASPTFRASYSGLLKSFFDRFTGQGLAGVLAIPLMSGRSGRHALAVEMYLRPALV
jgi:FMN reductase